MKNLILIILLSFTSIYLAAQTERFFSPDEADEKLTELIAFNFQVIGENNEFEFAASSVENIEVLFVTDTKDKALQLKTDLQKNDAYSMHKVFYLEEHWIVTGEVAKLPMEIKTFNEWTTEIFKLGLGYDCKLLNWSLINEEGVKKVNEFWNWFVQNEEEYYTMDHTKVEEMNLLFDKLQDRLIPINPSLVFEFSPILENGKREFVLSADGHKAAFADLLFLFKRSPDHNNWDIIPFKQAHEGDPKIEFNNGYKFSWDKVKFTSEETQEGLSVKFYIKDYDPDQDVFGMGLFILLDTLLGEYDAVTQITYVDLYKLDNAKSKNLRNFEELKTVVDEYKRNKK